MALYRVIDPAGGPVSYFIVIGPRPVGRYSCEGYGVRAEGPGGAAQVPPFTSSPRVAEELVEDLLAHRVPPRDLAPFVAAWRAPERTA